MCVPVSCLLTKSHQSAEQSKFPLIHTLPLTLWHPSAFFFPSLFLSEVCLGFFFLAALRSLNSIKTAVSWSPSKDHTDQISYLSDTHTHDCLFIQMRNYTDFHTFNPNPNPLVQPNPNPKPTLNHDMCNPKLNPTTVHTYVFTISERKRKEPRKKREQVEMSSRYWPKMYSRSSQWHIYKKTNTLKRTRTTTQCAIKAQTHEKRGMEGRPQDLNRNRGELTQIQPKTSRWRSEAHSRQPEIWMSSSTRVISALR